MNKASNINLFDRMALQRSAKVDDGFFMFILRGTMRYFVKLVAFFLNFLNVKQYTARSPLQMENI